jgi:peptidyl-prolyl cis-trans isomerase A (cyclophilin A)
MALGALVVAGCGSDARKASSAEGGAAPTTAASRGESLDPEHPIVLIDTSVGKIRVRLDAVNAPATVWSFLNYVRDGFYTNTLIHYVDADKMILGGGYSVDSRPKVTGTTIRNEAHNGLKNVRGTIAMARDRSTGIDNATSQFFINLADSPEYDHRGESLDEYGYCVFGEVTEGLDVADQISRSKTADRGGELARTPEPPVVIKSIAVTN